MALKTKIKTLNRAFNAIKFSLKTHGIVLETETKENAMSIHNELKFLVSKEKYYTGKILEKFVYLLNSKDYCELGYGSLYEYAQKELGYSEDQAYRRILAAKVIRAFPEGAELSLSQLVKSAGLLKDKNLDRAEKLKIILGLKNKTNREIDLITKKSKSKKVELDEKTLKLVDEVKYDLNTSDINEIISKLCQFYKRKTAPKIIKTRAIKVDKRQLSIETFEATRKQSRYIKSEVKKAVLKKSNHQCEFRGINGRRCADKTKLEFAHHYPYSLGGENTLQNLKIFCKSHNLYENKTLEEVAT